MRAAAFLAVLLFGCGTPSMLEQHSLEQKIPRTSVSIRMVPLAASRISMSATEITWDAYDVFVFGLDGPDPEVPAGVDAIARPSRPSALAFDRGFGHAGYPAISISFKGAQAFCRWLSARTGRRYRLPTEAEWELAARGVVDLDRAAWTREDAEGKTHPVASKEPTGEGLHDLLGNAAEWCTAPDGSGVVRGGSYRDPRERLRERGLPTPAWNQSDPQVPKSKWWLADAPFVGFRVVREER